MKRSVFLLTGIMLVLFFSIFSGPTPAQEENQTYYLQREGQANEKIKLRLQSIRDRIREQGLTFQVGYTTAMDYPLEQLTGLVPPPDLDARIEKQVMKLRAVESPQPAAGPCLVTAASFDWRMHKGSTGVRNQGPCGSCWDFATHGAFEGAYRIRNNCAIDSSEQDTLDCNPWGYGCGGGWWAFKYLVDTGSARESAYAYIASKGTCKQKIVRPYRAESWGYVSGSASPSVAAIKKALCTYGPLAVAVQVTGAFQAYTGGVFNACAETRADNHAYQVGHLVYPTGKKAIWACISAGTSSGTEPAWPVPTSTDPHPTVNDGSVIWRYSGVVNHGVTLIGWSNAKSAWLIKNSWGTGWGSTCGYGTQKGYMWIRYNCNNIGYGAAWAKAAKMTGCCK